MNHPFDRRSDTDIFRSFRAESETRKARRAEGCANFATESIGQRTIEGRGEQLPPVRQTRPATGNGDISDRATLFDQHIEAVRECKRNTFQNRPREVRGGRVRPYAEEDATRMRIVMRCALAR